VEKRFKITIEEEQFENTLTTRSWEKGGPDKNEDDNGEYGYTPQIPQQKKVKRTIFAQDTNGLDLVAVIKAINKIE